MCFPIKISTILLLNSDTRPYEFVTETSHSICTFYFDEAIKCVELKNIHSQFEKYALESDVPKSYIEDFIKNFKWAWWWLKEDEMKRSMVEEK